MIKRQFPFCRGGRHQPGDWSIRRGGRAGQAGAGTGDDYEIWSWAPLQSEATLQERQIV